MTTSEYRIEDLAQHSGATVRTIRAYQDRGLLPKPERRGRANVYDDTHLERLRRISELLERGYTLSSIKELLEAWDSGRGLGGVLGLVEEVDRPWSDEESGRVTASELAELFGGEDGDEQRDRAIEEAIALGVLVRPQNSGAPTETKEAQEVRETQEIQKTQDTEGADEANGTGEAFLVPSPQELAVAAELHSAGVPLLAITAHLRELRDGVEHIAARFLDFTNEHVFVRYLAHTPTDGEAAEAAELVRRLRPLAQQAVDAELARAMGLLASRNLRDHLRTAAAAPRTRPEAPATEPVLLPSETMRYVRDLVGEVNVAAFVAAATEREAATRTMDRLTSPERTR